MRSNPVAEGKSLARPQTIEYVKNPNTTRPKTPHAHVPELSKRCCKAALNVDRGESQPWPPGWPTRQCLPWHCEGGLRLKGLRSLSKARANFYKGLEERGRTCPQPVGTDPSDRTCRSTRPGLKVQLRAPENAMIIRTSTTKKSVGLRYLGFPTSKAQEINQL